MNYLFGPRFYMVPSSPAPLLVTFLMAMNKYMARSKLKEKRSTWGNRLRECKLA